MILKKGMLAVALTLLTLISLPLHMRSQEAAPARVTVAVRVFDGNNFVPGLNLQDFELLENGVPQKLENLFQVDKSSVVRKDGPAEVLPDTSRKFYMLFQMFEYHPKLSEAIHHLFNEVLLPGDSLEVQTPMKVYRLSPQALAKMSKEALAKDMVDRVKKDIAAGSSLYRGLLGELKRFIRALEGTQSMAQIGEEGGDEASDFSLELILPMYRDSLIKMEALRAVDEKKLLAFAQVLKRQEGQKFVFFVYQREFRPEISSHLLQSIISGYQERPDILTIVQDLFQLYNRNVSLNPDRVQKAFADSGINFNFLFMNKNPETYSGIVMREQSEDVYNVLSKIAGNSGGVIDNSQNPAASITSALNTSEKYYLLYYFPASQVKDGTFRKFNVKIKGKGYQVVSRLGRFS